MSTLLRYVSLTFLTLGLTQLGVACKEEEDEGETEATEDTGTSVKAGGQPKGDGANDDDDDDDDADDADDADDDDAGDDDTTVVVDASSDAVDDDPADDDTGPTCVAPPVVLHVTYETGDRGLRYGTNECGSWAFETIGGTGAGYHPALALDSSDRPAIVAYVDGGHVINVSKRGTDKAWTTVGVANDFLNEAAIAFDSQDHVHVAYGSAGDDHLYHLTDESGSWSRELLDGNADVGLHVAMAIDSTDQLHVAHYQATNWSKGYLKYTTGSTGSWATEYVDLSTDAGSGFGGVSILVDPDDHAHIAFHQYKDQANVALDDLYVSTNASGSFAKTLVHPNSAYYTAPAIFASGDGEVHVAHFTSDTNVFEIRDYNTGLWTAAAANPGAIEGYGASYIKAEMDADGHIHMITTQYVPAVDKHVMTYSTNISGAWVHTTLDDIGASAWFDFAIEGMRARNNRP